MMFDELFEAKTSLSGTWIPQSEDRTVFPIGENADLHQKEMFEELRRGDSDAILNTNPTGAGKTLSWVAPTIRSGEGGDGWRVLATYPTKALVEDQYDTILEHFESYYGSDEYSSEREFHLEIQNNEKVLTNGDEVYPLSDRVVRATSDTVESTSFEIRRVKEESAKPSMSGVPTVVLTTPDTLTIIAADLPFDADETSTLADFDRIVVDEFHLANPRGKRLLPFYLDVTMNLPSLPYLDKLVFLSATPLPNYIKRVEGAFDSHHVTNGTRETPDTESRHILPEADLHVTSRDMFSNGEWLADNIDAVVDFYEPAGQMLVVLDSVREVDEVYNTLEEETDLTAGRIYGWKKKGRAKTIKEADIVVGNTAVEVGIDFDDLNRVISTAYEPTSAIQRIGRMRHSERIDDYGIALITKPKVQSRIVRQGRKGLGRQELESVLIDELRDSADLPYYELLCAAYAQYLWHDSEEYEGDKPLKAGYVSDISDEKDYSEIVYKHFADGAEEALRESLDVEKLWNSVDEIRSRFYRDGPGKYPIFEEMHTFRPSSLSCLILDMTDYEEPIKTYQLRHALKYCNGYLVKDNNEFLSEYEKHPEFDESRQELIEDDSDYVCAYFVVTGKKESPRYFEIVDYAWSDSMESRWENAGRVTQIWDPSVKTDPAIRGMEYVQIGEDSEQKILARYVGHSRDESVDRFHLGPYANAEQIGKSSTILFWQDAILAEAQIAYDYFGRLHESK
jgi:CRISPR-associated endonuclease/helicase Cas3